MKEKSNASALDKHQKLSTRGREQHDLRPKVALLAAAIRVTCGREQIIK